MKEKHSWLLWDQDSKMVHLSGSQPHMFAQMSPCVSGTTPPLPHPKSQQQLHILFKSSAMGHP